MESLPPEIISYIGKFSGLFRSEVFASFLYLFFGILLGEAKHGTVRASVFAPADYQPQRLSDLFCVHKLSHQAFMAKLVEVALSYIYPKELPKRLFWIADSTQTEKPHSNKGGEPRLVSPHEESRWTSQEPQRSLLCLRRPPLRADQR